jgi:hypothetical protein
MKPIAIASLLSFMAAFAAASWVYRAFPGQLPDANTAGSNPPAMTDESRIVALEQAVKDERNARQLLQEEVIVLSALLGDVPSPAVDYERRSGADDAGTGRDDLSAEDRRSTYARRNSPEGKIERLLSRGIDPSLANWIVKREEELQMAALQARYEAGQNGSPADFYREQLSPDSILREELGDENFERYLDASGRPTSVPVSSVLGSSPAEAAGLKAGDVIVRYDGERVFSMTDINLASMNGQAGESVAIDILRDGIAMQVAMPRGPLGITGGRR